MGVVGYAEAEGDAREVRAARGGEEEDEAVSPSYHGTVLSGKLRQAVCPANYKEGGGCVLPYDQCTKTGQQVADFLLEKHPDMRVPPVKNLVCTSFEEYEEFLETVPLNITEDYVTRVAENLSRAAGALGAEAIELRNWLLCFGYLSEKLRVVVARLEDWMSNSSLLWAINFALMTCRLVAINKRPRVCPVGVGETLHRALAKLVMRAAWDQAKEVCGNLQLCAGLEAGIGGANHAVGQWIIERVRVQRIKKEAETSDEEEESGGVAAVMNNLKIEMAGTEEEATKNIQVVLNMEIGEAGGDVAEGEEGGDGN